MPTPPQILHNALTEALTHLESSFVPNSDIGLRVELVSRNVQNRACVRFLLSCLVAKIHAPSVDIRKPYTEIGDQDSFSGRTYDERDLSKFIVENKLPCNATTAFLTPAFRNIDFVLTPDVSLVGRPREVYQATLQLLTDVHEGKVTAETLLAETVRMLVVIRNEKLQRMQSYITALQMSKGDLPLSAESIVTLIEQHLATRGSSRLPVLIVTAIYRCASNYLGERVLPLEAHNAADSQTHALGDVQITLVDDENVITAYEMKLRRVSINDIDQAVAKIGQAVHRVDNYIFITTEEISDEVKNYARSIYEQTGGVEIVVLDCIGFLRHFLHLFHRLRMQFLDAYQELVLAEPDSSVSQPLKEAFLSLRQAAESNE
jgi:DNA adenine methylase